MLTWTTTKPTVNGYYWFRYSNMDKSSRLVEVHAEAGGVMVYLRTFGSNRSISVRDPLYNGEWFGPLDPPPGSCPEKTNLAEAFEALAKAAGLTTPEAVAAAEERWYCSVCGKLKMRCECPPPAVAELLAVCREAATSIDAAVKMGVVSHPEGLLAMRNRLLDVASKIETQEENSNG